MIRTDTRDELPLWRARRGEVVRVARLEGHESMCHRLREMGFCELAEIRVMHNNGSLVCQICGSRVGLSRQLAESIFVEPAAV